MDEGCNSWMQIPTSLSEAVGDLADDSTDATNDSESIRNSIFKNEAVEEFQVSFLPSFFFLIDNGMFALFVYRTRLTADRCDMSNGGTLGSANATF